MRKRLPILLLCMLLLLAGCKEKVTIGETKYPIDTVELDLSGAPLENVEVLGQFTQLKALNVCNTGINGETYDKLTAMLPGCQITWTPMFQGKAYPADTTALTVAELTGTEEAELAYFPKLTHLDALRIIAMTDGIPALADLFQLDLSFEENVQSIFAFGSLYLRYAEENLRREFRSPESYNTLLYGMAIGFNRISQLAEFSGYPKNKCDKYLKALDTAGYIEKEQKRDETGTVRTHYYLKGGYLRVWYQIYFPRQHEFIDPLTEETVKDLVSWIDACATKYYFRKLCWRWFFKNTSLYYAGYSIGKDNPSQYDVTINGSLLDFVQHDKDRDLYMKIWDDPEVGFPKDVFQKIEAATTTVRPFYDNVYYLFSIGRVCNYVEELRKLDTVAVVELRSFFGRNNAEYFKDLHE